MPTIRRMFGCAALQRHSVYGSIKWLGAILFHRSDSIEMSTKRPSRNKQQRVKRPPDKWQHEREKGANSKPSRQSAWHPAWTPVPYCRHASNNG